MKNNELIVNFNVSPCYRPLLLNCVKMLHVGYSFQQIVDLHSGRASGKSHVIFEIMIVLLTVFPNDDGIITVYNVRHKTQTARLLRTKFKKFGLDFIEKTGDDGEKIFIYGNNNSISVLSLKANSKDEEREKMKTSINYNYENGGYLRFLVMEEWTAIIDIYDNYLEANNAISSFGRLRPKDDKYMTFFIYNPPNNDRHNVYEWEKFIQLQDVLNVSVTILDLPPELQSKEDLKIIDTWRKMGNIAAIDHYYMGKPNLKNGLAYDLSYKCFVDYPDTNMIDYQITVDNGSKDATTFSVWGISDKFEVYYMDGYYHSGRQTGRRKRFSEYAKILAEYVRNTSYKISAIITDSLIFTDELAGFGIESHFIEKKQLEGGSFREACYDYSSELVERQKLFICRNGDYMMLFNQLANATKDTKGKRTKIKRPNNESTPEDKQIHKVDTFTYFVYYNSKRLLGREKVRDI